MFKGPDDRVQDKLELGVGDGQERVEAVEVDCLQKQEEIGSVFRELLKVLKKMKINLNYSITIDSNVVYLKSRLHNRSI